MMHPDEIEEMDYACNARSDYMWEAYGAESYRELQMEIEASFWDYERECDIRDIPTVLEARHERHVVCCMSHFFWVVSSLSPDYCPF